MLTHTVNFGTHHLSPVVISSTGSAIAGESYILTCSATLFDPVPLPSNIPTPNFEWFFGLNGNASVPFAAPTATTVQSGHTFSSTLQFPLLSQSHSGMYTCRLGVGHLANSTTVNVQGTIEIIFNVITNLFPLVISSTRKYFYPDQY